MSEHDYPGFLLEGDEGYTFSRTHMTVEFLAWLVELAGRPEWSGNYDMVWPYCQPKSRHRPSQATKQYTGCSTLMGNMREDEESWKGGRQFVRTGQGGLLG